MRKNAGCALANPVPGWLQPMVALIPIAITAEGSELCNDFGVHRILLQVSKPDAAGRLMMAERHLRASGAA